MDGMGSDKHSESEDILDTEWTEARAEELIRNAEACNLCSYQLSSVVSHKGALPIQAVTSVMGSK